MTESAKDVKDNKVVDPSATPEPVKKEDVTPEPSKDVKPDVTDPAKPVDDKVVDPEDKNPFVPRGRLNEEISKRRELEAKIAELENARNSQPPAVFPQNQQTQKNEIDIMAEQMSQEAGQDEFGNPYLPVNAAKVVVINQLKINHAATAGTKLNENVNEFVKNNPRASKYADRIKQELSKMAPGVKDNPLNVQRMYKELLGADMEVIEREAEERGKTKAMEQKRIISNASGEKPSGIPEGKTAEDVLTEAEKAEARKSKISYENYYKAKTNGRRV